MPYANTLIKMKKEHHQGCLFNKDFFDLDINFEDDGTLICHFDCDEKYQGYTGMMHGGIISALIDSTMTQCLFGSGFFGYTVRLNLRFAKKVQINKPIRIEVKLKEDDSELMKELKAVVYQDNQKKVSAQSKFWLIDENDEDVTE